MKISEIIRMECKNHEIDPLTNNAYEMVHFDDIWGIALVACKPVSTVIYKIVIPARYYSSERNSDYYAKTVRTFFKKELAENAYNALVAN